MTKAVILLSMGGPKTLADVRPFLFNLFNDPAIIRLPASLRFLIAALIAYWRAPSARANYARIGGGSPLLANTEEQARALEAALAARGDYRCFVGMSYAPPSIESAVLAALREKPEGLTLLPLYPQFSTTTTASVLRDVNNALLKFLHNPYKSSSFRSNFVFAKAKRRRNKIESGIRFTFFQNKPDSGLNFLSSLPPQAAARPKRKLLRNDERSFENGLFKHQADILPVYTVPPFYREEFFLSVMARKTAEAIARARAFGVPKILFSAHGLPLSIVRAGDPYPQQCEETARALAQRINEQGVTESVLCYQSRVGAGAWLSPTTIEEVSRAARQKRPVVIVPIAFVSEHIETILELGIDAARQGRAEGAPFVEVVQTVSTDQDFIGPLASFVVAAEKNSRNMGVNHK